MKSGLLPRRFRRTLARPTSLMEGIGLHSGLPASVRVLPSLPFSGRIFREEATGKEILACAANAQEAARCTVLQEGVVRVQTVEHLLSSLMALGVDDCVIEFRGGEMPAADGSAAPFMEWILEAGLTEAKEHPAETERTLSRPLLISGESGISLAALPAPHFQATVLLDYPQPWIGTQAIHFDAAVDSYEQIASARTFGFLRELEMLRAAGLGLGASHENALALGEDGYAGIPRFADELVRHKLLDLIGDLSLAGGPLAVHVIAIKPSHAYNIKLARLLIQSMA